jgi:RNA polymerase sigma factor (sigma-70 family)
LRIVRRGRTEQLDQLDGYIFQTASSVLKDRYRRRKARFCEQHVVFEPDAHGGLTAGPDQTLLEREALGRVHAVLLMMPVRTRQVFILRRLEGMSFREISEHLGISVSGVEKHMLRAVRLLAARIGEDP